MFFSCPGGKSVSSGSWIASRCVKIPKSIHLTAKKWMSSTLTVTHCSGCRMEITLFSNASDFNSPLLAIVFVSFTLAGHQSRGRKYYAHKQKAEIDLSKCTRLRVRAPRANDLLSHTHTQKKKNTCRCRVLPAIITVGRLCSLEERGGQECVVARSVTWHSFLSMELMETLGRSH